MMSSISYPAGPHSRIAKKNTENRAPIDEVEGFDTICTAACQTALTATPPVGCVV